VVVDEVEVAVDAVALVEVIKVVEVLVDINKPDGELIIVV